MPNKRVTYFILFIILVVGVFLRVKSATVNDFWADEATGFFISKGSSIRDIILGTADPPHNFLYTLLMKGVLQTNTSVLFLRLPSLFFAWLNILLIYLIATRLIKNRIFGLICALLFSLSPYQIEYSWWARMYEMVLFFSLISVFSLILFLNSKNKWWGWLFVLSNILGYCTDYSFIWYLLTLNIIYFWFFLRKRVRVMAYLIWSDLLVLLCLPVLINWLPKIFAYHISWIEKPDFNILKATLLWFMGLKDYWDRNISNFWLIPLLVVVLLSIYLMLKKYKYTNLIYISVFSLLIPVGFSFMASRLMSRSIFLGWNFISISPAVILLEGIIIFSFLAGKKLIYQIIGCLLLGLIIYSNLHLYYYRTSGLIYPRKEGWYYKKTAELLSETDDSNSEGILVLGFRSLFRYYYQGYWENDHRDSRRLVLLDEDGRLDSRIKDVWVVLTPGSFGSMSEMEELKRHSYLKEVNFRELTPYYVGLSVYKIAI